MEPGRFDALARSLSSRLSRRMALKATGLAGATSLVGAAGRRTSAQDGTATPDPLRDDASFLFVQSAASGTFAANPDAGLASTDGTLPPGGRADYLLTLEGHTGNTVYFSDRPERIFGEAPTQQFLDGLGFSPSNPPNAALVTNDEQGNEDILIVELLTPIYDADAGTVTYGVNLLSDYEGGLDFVASRQQDEDLAPSFGTASLFIDDCPYLTECDQEVDGSFSVEIGPLPGPAIKQCWHSDENACSPCNGNTNQYYNVLCNNTYSNCDDSCVAG